jgi:hypothetical protein
MRALLCVLLLAATPAFASVPIMVAPFGDRDAQKELFNALELELEVEADLVLSDAAVLFEDLMVSDLSKAPAEEVAASLKRAGQSALIQSMFFDEDLYAVVYVLRASDGAVVFAQRVEVDLAVADARPTLVDALVQALQDVEVLEAVDDEKLIELKIKTAPPRIVDTTPEEPPKVEPPKEEPPKKGGPNRFSVLRVAASWSPSLSLYQACNGGGGAAPFLCTGGVTDVTPASVPALAGAGLQLEYYPVEWLGFEVRGGGGLTEVSLQVGGEEVLFEPGNIGVRSAGASAVAVLRMLYSNESFGIFTGLRLGYDLELLAGEPHGINVEGARREVIVVPEALGQFGVLGFGLGLSFNESVVMSVDLDLLGGLYVEDQQIWQERDGVIGYGGRAALGLDIALGGGAFVTVGGVASAIHAQGTGSGGRETLGLDDFVNGHARLIRLSGDVGVGWRF